ncbi:winged helix-turn-helix domain-containing protein [Thermococcus onnurineus]|nr:LysR family transcriptional regulator [Thermococcus onnurineus]
MVMGVIVVQPSGRCDATCANCIWRERLSGVMLPGDVLPRIASLLDGFRFDEGILMCPNPFLHPKIKIIYDELRDISKRVTVFIPLTASLSNLRVDVLADVDMISIIVPPMIDIKRGDTLIRALESRGIDHIEAYLVFNSSSDPGEILRKIGECMKRGLRITVGPSLFSPPSGDMFIESISARKDVELGLHYGRKYLYSAMKVFLNDYPITLLMSPMDPCRHLYVNPYGIISKCPNSNFSVSYREMTRELLRKIFFSPCPNNKNPSFVPKVEISFVTSSGIKIPGDIMELLELISQTRSFRAACKIMGVSPSTYWERIRDIEEKLGRRLIVSVKGGRKKGITVLTGVALDLLKEYQRIRERVLLSLNERF